jgi:hypothetical protein
MLHQMIVTPSFIQYSNGRCWTWESTFEATGPGYDELNFVLDHFSDQIYYACGYLPSHEIDTRVYVVPTTSGGNVTGISIRPQSVPGTSCPGSTLDIGPVSLNLVSWNSSGQTVSLKLQYLSYSNASLQSLVARIYNSTWSYDIVFSGVNSTHPLLPGSSWIQVSFIAGAPLRSNVVYDMTATGTYVDGTQTISSFKVQLQT